MLRSQECISSMANLLFSVFMWDLTRVPEPPQLALGIPSHGSWSRRSDQLLTTNQKESFMLKIFGFGFLAVTQSPAIDVCLLNCNKIKVIRTPNFWWILDWANENSHMCLKSWPLSLSHKGIECHLSGEEETASSCASGRSGWASERNSSWKGWSGN